MSDIKESALELVGKTPIMKLSRYVKMPGLKMQ